MFSVSYVFPINSVYRDKFNNAILYMQEAGIVSKLKKDVSWSLQKTKEGRFRQASVGQSLRVPTATAEKGLTLADTEGMFLLMGVGYLIGAGVLISEWVGGCTNKCREIIKSRRERQDSLVSSNTSSANQNSPRRRRRPSGKEYNLTENIDSSSTLPITPRQADDDSGSDVSERTRHHRSLSENFQELNQNTLHDLYDGPNRRHSTIVCIDGKVMSEEEARRYASSSRKHKHSSSLTSVVEHEVTRLFKYLDDHKSTHEDLREQSDKHSSKKSIEIAVEVNRSAGEVSEAMKASRQGSLDVPFGEKVLY